MQTAAFETLCKLRCPSGKHDSNMPALLDPLCGWPSPLPTTMTFAEPACSNLQINYNNLFLHWPSGLHSINELGEGGTKQTPRPTEGAEDRRSRHSLGAEGALFLQLPVPEHGAGRRHGVDGAGERLCRAVLVRVHRGHQRVLADLGGHCRRQQQVTLLLQAPLLEPW